MLRGKLVLHDVPDVEVLCVKVVRSYERTTQADFPPADREDLVAYLIAAAWELSIRFDAGRGVPFESILRLQLPFRVVDFIRKNNGRTSWRFSSHEYTREAVRNLSLDAPASADDGHPRSLGDVVAAPWQAFLRKQIALPLSLNDSTVKDVAAELGTSESFVNGCIRRFKTERPDLKGNE
jgi:hypothetical protein